MDKRIRRRLIADYKSVNDNILRILGGGPNFSVRSENYINPVTVSDTVSLNDFKGELYYFRMIHECLEQILIHGKTFSRIPQAPSYVTKFFN